MTTEFSPPESWRIFIEYYPAMQRAAHALAAEPWFADGWVTSILHFSEGIALHLYKAGWHNARGRGIHLEAWISIDGVAARSVPVVLHTERDLPDRERFNRLFRERSGEIMATWRGYHISRTNVMEHAITRFRLSGRTLVARLVAEFSRMREVGDIVDAILMEMEEPAAPRPRRLS